MKTKTIGKLEKFRQQFYNIDPNTYIFILEILNCKVKFVSTKHYKESNIIECHGNPIDYIKNKPDKTERDKIIKYENWKYETNKSSVESWKFRKQVIEKANNDYAQICQKYEIEKKLQFEKINKLLETQKYYIFEGNIYLIEKIESLEHIELIIKQHVIKENKKWNNIKKEIDFFEKYEKINKYSRREPIPEEVRHEVWRRDQGKCIKCGSSEKLEFDHIIPFSKGGSDSARNIQLLCERCNREKTDKI